MMFIKIDGQEIPEANREAEMETEAYCYSESELVDLKSVLFAGAEEQCVGSNFVMDGGKLSVSISCEFGPDQGFAGDLHGSYDQAHFELSGVMVTRGDTPSELIGSVNATRMGVCESPG